MNHPVHLYYYFFIIYKSRVLKWHYHIKMLQGHFTKLKKEKSVCEAQIVQLLTLSGKVQRLPISHNTTTGILADDESCKECCSDVLQCCVVGLYTE